MSRTITVRVLVENTARGHGMLAEHGLAVHVDTGDHHVLFDTGQGLPGVLSTNARRLGVDLGRIDAVVLSHGHYDHTGGLADVLPQTDRATVYAHPDAFEPTYGPGRDIGMSAAALAALDDHAGEVVLTESAAEVCDGLFVTGRIPRVTDFEDTGGAFFRDEACRRPDPMHDDQALFLEATVGTVVLLGCAHAGVINTLYHIRSLTGDPRIQAVFGGMHLGRASPERLTRTVEALEQFKIRRLGPAHCTGTTATAALWRAFPERCQPFETGTRLDIRCPDVNATDS